MMRLASSSALSDDGTLFMSNPPPPLPAALQSRLETYCNIMHEISWRMESLKAWGEPKIAAHIPQHIMWEYSHLQLRMSCELIATAALLAHGDIKETKTNRFQKAYNAEWIINALGKIHPDFYPRPFRPAFNKTANIWHAVPLEAGFLMQKELPKLYARCGTVLHRGSLRSILSLKPREPDFKAVNAWLQKIANLLSYHAIALKGSADEYWFSMMGENGVSPKISLMKSFPLPADKS